MTKEEIEAFFEYLKDYPDGMNLWEKESLAAEAVLAARKKPSKKKKPELRRKTLFR